jgi:hypothetical protein
MPTLQPRKRLLAKIQLSTTKKSRYTFAPNGWYTTNKSRLGGVEFLTVGVPDDFDAYRVGFLNITAVPFKVTKVIACSSSRWNDYFNPISASMTNRPSSDWVTATFMMAGSNISQIVTVPDAPTSAIVGGNTTDVATGQTAMPRIYWSDWTPCQSVGADPLHGMRVLMLRCQMPGDQTVTTTNGQLAGWSGVPSVHHGYGSDHVTDPAASQNDGTTAALLVANRLYSGQVMAIIEVITRNAGHLIMTGGDSQQQGTGTTSQFNGFLPQAVFPLGISNVGHVPLGLLNVAQGGAKSNQFFPRMMNFISAASPSVVILPGWSYNDFDGLVGESAGTVGAFFSRLQVTADAARLAGAVPIFLTPFPRDAAAMTPDRVAIWRALRQSILNMAGRGEIVVDATAVLGHTTFGELDGTYIAPLTNDNKHPNDDGHAAVASLIRPILREICGI